MVSVARPAVTSAMRQPGIVWKTGENLAARKMPAFTIVAE